MRDRGKEIREPSRPGPSHIYPREKIRAKNSKSKQPPCHTLFSSSHRDMFFPDPHHSFLHSTVVDQSVFNAVDKADASQPALSQCKNHPVPISSKFSRPTPLHNAPYQNELKKKIGINQKTRQRGPTSFRTSGPMLRWGRSGKQTPAHR